MKWIILFVFGLSSVGLLSAATKAPPQKRAIAPLGVSCVPTYSPGCQVTLTWVDNSVDATLQQSQTVDNFYEYQVMAVNSVGQSPPSNVASYTVPKAATVPKPATNLILSFKGATGKFTQNPGRDAQLNNSSGTLSIKAAEIIITELK